MKKSATAKRAAKKAKQGTAADLGVNTKEAPPDFQQKLQDQHAAANGKPVDLSGVIVETSPLAAAAPGAGEELLAAAIDDKPLLSDEPDPEREALAAEAAAMRKQINELTNRLHAVNEMDAAIIDAERRVTELEAEIRDIDTQKKELRAELKQALGTLQASVIRRRNGEVPLIKPEHYATDPTPAPPPKPAAAAPLGIDIGADCLIEVLESKQLRKIVGAEEFDRAKNSEEPIGMGAKKIETLEADGLTTIGKLEKKMKTDEWWHRDLTGFGPEAINRLTWSLFAFRRKHPIPVAVETTSPEPAVVPPAEAPPADVAPVPPEPAEDFGAGLTPAEDAAVAASSEAMAAAAAEAAGNEIPGLPGEVIEREPLHWEAAVAELRALIRDAIALTNDGPADSIDFAESVTLEASAMLKNVKQAEAVTLPQLGALANWRKGVDAWQPQQA